MRQCSSSIQFVIAVWLQTIHWREKNVIDIVYIIIFIENMWHCSVSTTVCSGLFIKYHIIVLGFVEGQAEVYRDLCNSPISFTHISPVN